MSTCHTVRSFNVNLSFEVKITSTSSMRFELAKKFYHNILEDCGSYYIILCDLMKVAKSLCQLLSESDRKL